MTTYLESKPQGIEKVMGIVLLIVFIAFIVYIPFALANKQEKANQAWQESGCQMYDKVNISNVPAKCHNEFTDHYAPQEQRTQPPKGKQ